MIKRFLAAVLAMIMLTSVCFAEEPTQSEAPQTPEATEPPVEETTEPPVEETTEPPVEETTEPPAEETTEPPAEETTEPPAEETTEPPTEETTEPPTEEPTCEPSAQPTIDPECEAWRETDAGLIWGALEELLPPSGEEATIYILTADIALARNVTEQSVEKVEFLPDPEKYPPDRFECRVAFGPLEGIEPPADAETYMYVWVQELLPAEPTPTPAPESTPTPAPTVEIGVASENYVPDTWSGEALTFTLSGIPDGLEHYSYAAIEYDERFIVLSGNTYTASAEGNYKVRFVILDEMGDVAAKSDEYCVMLDMTPPGSIVVEPTGTSGKKYSVSASDAASGVAAYSNDGGESWKSPNADGVAIFKGKPGQTIPAGMILARDAAGNVSAYDSDFYLPSNNPGGPGGGGGGGGGGGEAPKPHSPLGDDVELNPYNGLELEISDEPMNPLVMGDEELDLSMELEFAGDVELEKDFVPQFTARLDVWASEPAPEDINEINEPVDAKYDTLILTVADGELPGEEYFSKFTLGGVVLRMLYNSGIDYLVFETRYGCVALPTEGFVAGTEYTRMKAEGVSTRKMSYELYIAPGLEEDLPQLALELSVEGDEGSEVYPLSADETCEIYYCNVQTGAIGMMDEPFGAETEDEK